jgi:DNA-binding MarR family transcriptional regulator
MVSGMYEVLRIIRFEENISTLSLMNLTGLSRKASCNNLNRLVKVGLLVFKNQYLYKGRRVYYVFTPEGRELYDKLYGSEKE